MENNRLDTVVSSLDSARNNVDLPAFVYPTSETKRQLISPPPFAVKLAMFSDLLDVAFQRADAMTNLPAVHFQLGFAGTAGADAAAKTGQIFPMSCQSGQAVFELGEFNLQLAFFSASAPRKNIEDEASAVDDFCFEGFLEVLGLAGRSSSSNMTTSTPSRRTSSRSSSTFPFPMKCRGIGPLSSLHDFIDYACASGRGQLTQLIQRVCDQYCVFHHPQGVGARGSYSRSLA